MPDTTQQKAALEYVEGLKYTNSTVTGHSKGGNKSQYVAIVSDKVDRCVSLDGQGFSKEFLEKYREEIAANRHKITNISAANDFVNCLLNQIATKHIFIATESQGKDFLNYHCPDIVLNANGNLREVTEQAPLAKLVNKFSVYVNTKVEDPYRREVINGLIAKAFEGPTAEESLADQEEAIEMLKEIVIDFAKEELTQGELRALISQDELHDFGFAMINEKYGLLPELLVASFSAAISPKLFVDDLTHALQDGKHTLLAIAMQNIRLVENSINKARQRVTRVINDARAQIQRKSFTSGMLSVDLVRLAELQNKMRDLEREFEDRIRFMLDDVRRLTANVDQEYDEHYVQKQIYEVNRTCDLIRESHRRLCDALERKVRSLHYTLVHYKEIENLLCKEIG